MTLRYRPPPGYKKWNADSQRVERSRARKEFEQQGLPVPKWCQRRAGQTWDVVAESATTIVAEPVAEMPTKPRRRPTRRATAVVAVMPTRLPAPPVAALPRPKATAIVAAPATALPLPAILIEPTPWAESSHCFVGPRISAARRAGRCWIDKRRLPKVWEPYGYFPRPTPPPPPAPPEAYGKLVSWITPAILGTMIALTIYSWGA